MKFRVVLFLFVWGLQCSSFVRADYPEDVSGVPSHFNQYDARRFQITPSDSETEGYLVVEETVSETLDIKRCTTQRTCSLLTTLKPKKSGNKIIIKEHEKLKDRPYTKYALIAGAGVLGALEWSGIYRALTEQDELSYLVFYVVGAPVLFGGTVVLGPPAIGVALVGAVTYAAAQGPTAMFESISTWGRWTGNLLVTGISEVLRNLPSYTMHLMRERPVWDLGAIASFALSSYAAYYYLHKSSSRTIHVNKSLGTVVKTTVTMRELIEAIKKQEQFLGEG